MSGASVAMLSVRELLVTFGQGADRVTAVNRISFDVAEGEWYGLVGESGSGKTTVVRAVSGLLLDWDGTIVVAGQKQARRRSRSFHKLLQMVFQDPYGSLHPRHTVDRALSEPVAIHGLGKTGARGERALQAGGVGPRIRH